MAEHESQEDFAKYRRFFDYYTKLDPDRSQGDIAVAYFQHKKEYEYLATSSEEWKFVQSLVKSTSAEKGKTTGRPVQRNLPQPFDHKTHNEIAELPDINDIIDDCDSSMEEEYPADQCSDLHLTRRKICYQSGLMNETVESLKNGEIEQITIRQFEENDDILDGLVKKYKEILKRDAVAAMLFFDIEPARVRSIRDENLGLGYKPHIIAMKELLLSDHIHGAIVIFVIRHFPEMGDFLDFLIKMCPRDGWLDTPIRRKLPQRPIGKAKEQSLKKEVFKRIVDSPPDRGARLLYKVRKVIPYDLLPKEEDFINKIVTLRISDNTENLEKKILPQFSLNELRDLEYKITEYVRRALNYKIWANGQQILKICYDGTVSKGSKPLPSFSIELPGPRLCMKQLKEEYESHKTLQSEVGRRIHQSPSLEYFLLEPVNIDFLSWDEKLLFLFARTFTLTCFEEVRMASFGLLQRFARKLDAFERRMKEEGICYCVSPKCDVKTTKKQPYWLPRNKKELDLRQVENVYILIIFRQLFMFHFEGTENPEQRVQHNKDFKYMFVNRDFVLRADLGYNLNTNSFDKKKLQVFYEGYVNPERKEENKMKDYIEEIEKKIKSDRRKQFEVWKSVREPPVHVVDPLEEESEEDPTNHPPDLNQYFEHSKSVELAINDVKTELRRMHPWRFTGEVPLFFDGPGQLRPRSAELKSILGLTWRKLRQRK